MLAATIINFNAPELNALALALSEREELYRFVRPYLQKGRWWERCLAAAPGLGRWYGRTLGRRVLPFDTASLGRVRTAGVAEDVIATVLGRMKYPSTQRRERWALGLQERLRVRVGEMAAAHVEGASHVIAYPGFGLPAFQRARETGLRCILSYPIAHHRHHLALRQEEAYRMPEFAASWPELRHFTDEYLSILDAEIAAADLILVGSQYTRRTFIAEGVSGERIKVVPYGVDTSLFAGRDKNETERFRIAFAGQIGQRKGISYLLEAYSRFRDANTELWLIGRLSGMDALPPRYTKGVQHIAHMPRPELAKTLADCDVFVFPTLLEGMPLVVVEAMAAGLPVIATRNGPDEVIRDGVDGFLVPERDPQAIVDRLQTLRADPTLRAAMSQSARQRAAEFTWRHFSDRAREALVLLGAKS